MFTSCCHFSLPCIATFWILLSSQHLFISRTPKPPSSVFSLLFHFLRPAFLVAGSSWVSLSVCMSQSRLFFLLQPLLLLGCSCSVIRVLFHLLFFLLQLQEIWPTQLDSRWRRRMANGNNLWPSGSKHTYIYTIPLKNTQLFIFHLKAF